MAAETNEATSDVQIEDVGPCRKKISITIPAEAVRRQIEESLETVSHEAAIPGFRKGRVPKSIVEKKFGNVVRNEAKQKLVSSAYQQAIQENDLSVIGEPDGAEELEGLEVDPEQDINFSFEVDIAPDFELPDLSQLELLKPEVNVTQEMVDDQIERMAVNNGELQHQDTPEPGDYYIGRGVMRAEGEEEPVLDISDAVIQIPPADSDGSGAILGVKVDDFREQLGLPAVGETATITTTGPPNHENPKVREANLTIEFTPERIERIVPLSPEQLAEGFGLEDEQQLRETIMLQLNRRAVVDQQSAMRQQVSRHLVENTDFDLPERLTAAQAEQNIERERYELMYRGLDPQAVEQRLIEMRNESDEKARRQLKLFFIVGKVANERGIEVTQSELNGRIAEIASSRGQRPDQLYQELRKENRLNSIATQIREHKVLDELAKEAQVREVSAEEYNEQMGSESEGEAS